jgi:transposase
LLAGPQPGRQGLHLPEPPEPRGIVAGELDRYASCFAEAADGVDNLAAHKIAGVRQAIAAVGASLLYLPPYSPDLNPIEQLFAKLKALLRKAAARTRDELWSLIGRLLEACPPAECANYLRHCNYGST